MIHLGKATDVRVPFGRVILHVTEIQTHPTWIMTKVQFVTDSDGYVIPGSPMVGREMPFAITDIN